MGCTPTMCAAIISASARRPCRVLFLQWRSASYRLLWVPPTTRRYNSLGPLGGEKATYVGFARKVQLPIHKRPHIQGHAAHNA